MFYSVAATGVIFVLFLLKSKSINLDEKVSH